MAEGLVETGCGNDTLWQSTCLAYISGSAQHDIDSSGKRSKFWRNGHPCLSPHDHCILWWCWGPRWKPQCHILEEFHITFEPPRKLALTSNSTRLAGHRNDHGYWHRGALRRRRRCWRGRWTPWLRVRRAHRRGRLRGNSGHVTTASVAFSRWVCAVVLSKEIKMFHSAGVWSFRYVRLVIFVWILTFWLSFIFLDDSVFYQFPVYKAGNNIRLIFYIFFFDSLFGLFDSPLSTFFARLEIQKIF